MTFGTVAYVGLLVSIGLYFISCVVRRICECVENCSAAEWRAEVEKYKLFLDYDKEMNNKPDTLETDL